MALDRDPGKLLRDTRAWCRDGNWGNIAGRDTDERAHAAQCHFLGDRRDSFRFSSTNSHYPMERQAHHLYPDFRSYNTAGAIQIHSIAPRVYTMYGYGKNLQFHGQLTPYRITIYAHGVKTP